MYPAFESPIELLLRRTLVLRNSIEQNDTKNESGLKLSVERTVILLLFS